MKSVSIGSAAKLSGVKVPTIRYYEQIGLLTPPSRTQANRREYDPNELERLKFIRHARQLGFDIEAIRTLLELQDQPHRPCGIIDSIAKARLAEVENRIQRLMALKNELERMISNCGGGLVVSCHVIKVLADHSRCLTVHDEYRSSGKYE